MFFFPSSPLSLFFLGGRLVSGLGALGWEVRRRNAEFDLHTRVLVLGIALRWIGLDLCADLCVGVQIKLSLALPHQVCWDFCL